MNKRLVLKILGATLLIEAATMLPSYVVALLSEKQKPPQSICMDGATRGTTLLRSGSRCLWAL